MIESLGIKKILASIPFLIMSEGNPQLNVTRIIEALIIAAVAGTLSAYVTMKEIDTKVLSLTAMVEKIDSRICEHRIWHLEKAEKNEHAADHPQGLK